ncbi:hypothetical protein [Parendozoicomonas sp. Alg238-R29]|uniref:hypothetical protein n=1 Tax=Parendozoicomonas sp. Alg238-R29 TaxID=2993446 RepID=UPI00248D5208|nr:hypothetical protein [Parendozoicomonas sp. Alg238-R29]
MAPPSIELFRRVPKAGFETWECDHTASAGGYLHENCKWVGHRIRRHGQPPFIAPFKLDIPTRVNARRLSDNIQEMHAAFLQHLGNYVVQGYPQEKILELAQGSVLQLKKAINSMPLKDAIRQLHVLQAVVHSEAAKMRAYKEYMQAGALEIHAHFLTSIIDEKMDALQNHPKDRSCKAKKTGVWTSNGLCRLCKATVDSKSALQQSSDHTSLQPEAESKRIPVEILERFHNDLGLFNTTGDYCRLVFKSWTNFKSARAGSSRNIDNFIMLIRRGVLMENDLKLMTTAKRRRAQRQAYTLLKKAGLHD